MATKRPDGRWHATWTHPQTRKRMYEYGETAEEADQKRDRARSDAGLEAPSGPTPSAELDLHTLAGLLWWPRVEHNRPNTLRRYRDIYDNEVRPRWGTTIPEDIRPAQVQAWVSQLSKDYQPKSVELIVSVLSMILRCCQREGLLMGNPCQGIRMPKAPKRIRTMDLDSARLVLSKVAETPLALPVYLALALGMSRGEVCGLKWDDVDDRRRRVSIRRQRMIIHKPSKKDPKKSTKTVGEGPLKRDSRERSFTLPPELFSPILELGDKDSAYVCTATKGGPWDPEELTKAWTAAKKDLGLASWTYHDLRHGAAGILAALGVDLLTIAAILGHSKIDTTQLYAAAQEATATAGLERLGKALFPPKS